MPRIRVNVKPPLEYLTAGRIYDVYIGQSDVTYQRVGPDGTSKGQPSTFGRRWDYAKYIASGTISIVPDNTPQEA